MKLAAFALAVCVVTPCYFMVDNSADRSSCRSGVCQRGAPLEAFELRLPQTAGRILQPRRLQSTPSGPAACLDANLTVEVAEPAGCGPASSSGSISWTDLLCEHPARLEHEHSWYSQKPSKIDVSIVVAFTVDRLEAMLPRLCSAWQGAVSAAVYLPILANETSGVTRPRLRADAITRIDMIFQRAEEGGGCRLDIQLMSEQLASQRMIDMGYPINALRNVALTMASTELIYILDGDLLPSASLSNELQSPAGWQRTAAAARAGAYVVIPAIDFSAGIGEAEGQRLVNATISEGKKRLLAALAAGRMQHFAADRSPECHRGTNLQKWAGASELYEVEYEFNYEPWGILARHGAPLFDERFRGYGMNKILYLAAVAGQKRPFKVHPVGFAVHRPHPQSGGRNLYLVGKEANAYKCAALLAPGGTAGDQRDTHCLEGLLFHAKIHEMGQKARAEIHEGLYKPVVSPRILHCQSVLPWWQERPALQ